MDVKLIVFREDGSKRAFSLQPGATTIGRKNDCTIRIPLATVSRRHAEVFVDDDQVLIKDLGTANGTFLNSQRVEQDDLQPGDQIMIGPVIFTVQIDGEPADEDLIAVRSKPPAGMPGQAARGASVTTSHHVFTADEEIDPISALEALASSADQTAIHPELEDEDA